MHGKLLHFHHSLAKAAGIMSNASMTKLNNAFFMVTSKMFLFNFADVGDNEVAWLDVELVRDCFGNGNRHAISVPDCFPRKGKFRHNGYDVI